MQQEKNNQKTNIISCVITSILTLILFVILGSFYNAVDHSIGINILVWLGTIFVAYYVYYFIYFIVRLFNKSLIKPRLIDGWSIFCGLVTITTICLFGARDTDDYLLINIMVDLSGIIGIFQLLRPKK